MRCKVAMQWAHEGTSSVAQQLRLEEHMEGCASCRQRLCFERGMRVLEQEACDPPLSEGQRRRVLSAALLASGEVPLPSETLRPRHRWVWGASAAVLAAGAVLAVAMQFSTRQHGAPQATGAEAPSAEVAAAERAPLADRPPSAATQEVPRWRSLGAHASEWDGVRLRARSKGAQARKETDGALRVRGAVKVSAHGGEEHRVRLAHYDVRFAAAEFEVRADTLQVAAGEVRVQRAGGAEVRIAAGEQWPRKGSRKAARRSRSRQEEAAATGEPRVARARRLLAHGDVQAAEAIAAQVARTEKRGLWRAEAQTLLAECSVARGDVQQAIGRYRAVARRYAGTVAGQNALFAAAQTAESAGRHVEARKLWQAYLQRYPEGLFRDEARRRLAR